MPDFRGWYGRLTRQSTEIDVAITRIRLSGVDLSEAELSGVSSLRLLLGEVNAVLLGSEAAALLCDPGRTRNLELMLRLLQSGVIQVRSAPLAGWSPDFTIFYGSSGPSNALVGPHWFQRPFPHRGPAFASLHGPREARRAAARFTELWTHSHEIGPAVRSILERSRQRRSSTGVGREALDRESRGAVTGSSEGTGNPCQSSISGGPEPVDTPSASG